jgi:hypothetical protein
MNTLEAQFPPLARAHDCLRQTRPAATTGHDLLRLMPEPAPRRPTAAAFPHGTEAARRTYWFDL